jgi:hypothetical protein
MPSLRRIVWTVCGLAVCGVSGCVERTSEAPATPVPVAPAIESSGTTSTAGEAGTVLAEAKERVFEGITVTVPAGWEERTPASEFIQAEYRLTGPGGPARLTMSSAGGGMDANIDRWRGQFTRGPDDPAPQEETITIGGEPARLIELHGTFRDGFGGGAPQPKSTMLGAVIPTGPANFFVKLTGPRETVAEHREAFRTLVTTARKK